MALDYRKSLFKLEEWSPFLAKKVWGWTSVLNSPITLAFGMKVRQISDLHIEIVLPLNRLTQSEGGGIHSTALLALGEFASKVLWQRHLTPGSDELSLSSIHCRFVKTGFGEVRARAELLEPERERILRKIRAGEEVDCEMAVLLMDEKDQQVAHINCVWHLKSMAPLALSSGRIG